MTDHTQFDVFLPHNSQDKPLVRIIAEELKQRDLKPWIDEEEIPPGQYFQDAIQKVIPQVKSALSKFLASIKCCNIEAAFPAEIG